MTRILLLILAAFGIVGALADLGSDSALFSRATPTNSSGYLGDYYYNFWTDDRDAASYWVYQRSYRIQSSGGGGNFVGGKGWKPGSAHSIVYSAGLNFTGNAYLSVYGWTTNPLIEYYIVETYGSYDPSTGATLMGSVTSDGGTYQIYQTQRVDQPSINGIATYNQYMSVRTEKRSNGTVTTGNHFDAWARLGMLLGSHDYQIVATEGHQAGGSSDVYLGCATLYSQCGGRQWFGPTCCISSTCKYLNTEYSQCQ